MLAATLPWEEFEMKRKHRGVLPASLLLAGWLVIAASPLLAQTKSAPTKNDSPAMPRVGDMAPDFTLKYFDGTDRKDVKLSDYRGKKNVVLAFFVFAFTGG
jgi:cytochrome oxidase Cu insertion factor (SCO1/SenC/PrrC family)